MTEAEWLASDDPAAMLKWLTTASGPSGYYVRHSSGRPLSDRKLRLFAVAAARWGGCGSWGSGSRWALQMAEKAADNLLDSKRLARKYDSFHALYPGMVAEWTLLPTGHEAAQQVVAHYCDVAGSVRGRKWTDWAVDILCDIVGNPFRPAAIKAEWRTPSVLTLARAAYDDHRGYWYCLWCLGLGLVRPRPDAEQPTSCGACCGLGSMPEGCLNPDRMAILSDALEDAGCDYEPLLRHLRGYDRSPEHAGDCWVPLSGPHVRGCWALDLVLGKE